MKSNEGYSSVPVTSEDSQSADYEIDLHEIPRFRRSRLHTFWPWALNFVLFAMNIALFIRWRTFPIDLGRCVEELNWYSPAVEAIKTDFENVRFSGLTDPNNVWRGEPTPEMEAAWDSVTWEMGEIAVTVEDAKKAGIELDENSLVRFPEEWGGEIYTSVEWTHHLHCLNMMRKFVRYDYYKDKDVSFTRPYSETVGHLDHCIDMIRQRVMCTPDSGLIFSHWIEGRDHRHVDFNTQHKCMNFQHAVDWMKERSKLPKRVDLVRHDGSVDLPTFPENLTVHTNGYKGSKWYQS